MLRSDLYDYSDAYVVVKEPRNLKTGVKDNMSRKDIAFKNDALKWSCIAKINSLFYRQYGRS